MARLADSEKTIWALRGRVNDLEEQNEALMKIALAARDFDARFEERFIHGMAKPLNDAISAYYESFQASRSE